MADPQRDRDDDSDEPFEVDGTSLFYILGGVPFMIVFFVALFVLVGIADSGNVMIPF